MSIKMAIYLKYGARYDQGYYDQLTGSRIRAFNSLGTFLAHGSR